MNSRIDLHDWKRPLPARPRPANDELLSSWIARFSLANGLKSDELLRGLGIRFEPYMDILGPASVLSRLESISGVKAEVLRAGSTLSNYQWMLYRVGANGGKGPRPISAFRSGTSRS